MEIFPGFYSLIEHFRKHKAFACKSGCTERFARLDLLHKHFKTHKASPWHQGSEEAISYSRNWQKVRRSEDISMLLCID
jgi:hypothetical protein